MCCIFQQLCCGTTDLSIQDDHIEDLQKANSRCSKISRSLKRCYPKGYSMAKKDCRPIRDVLDQAIIQGAIEVEDIEAYHRLFTCMCRLNQIPRQSYNDIDRGDLKERLERFRALKDSMKRESMDRYGYARSCLKACTEKFNAAMEINGIKPGNIDDYIHIFHCIHQITRF